MKNFKILTVSAFSLMLLSGCSSNLPQDAVPDANSPATTSTASSTATPSPSPSKTATSDDGSTKPSSGDTPTQAAVLPGVVDNPAQRNQKLVPNPAPGTVSSSAAVPGAGPIIDGAKDRVGAGSKEDKQQAAESYISFVNLINEKDYVGACEYVKLKPSQGVDCLAAMDKVDIATRTYPVGLRIDRLDNGAVNGDTAVLNKLVFVYDGDKRLRDVYMFRPTDGSGKWKTVL